jgi:hypothetical protein
VSIFPKAAPIFAKVVSTFAKLLPDIFGPARRSWGRAYLYTVPTPPPRPNVRMADRPTTK